jgi:type VI secretion system protein ImpG
MEAQARPTTAPLDSDPLERCGLLDHGHEFSLAQVLRLALTFLGPDAMQQNRLRVRPGYSLGFPAADVAGVETTADGGLLVTATFGGLYGVDSPLPNHYSEDILDEASNDESALRDFTDIIHQRLYYLYYQCWSKYKLFFRVVEERDPADCLRLHCLLGLGEQELAECVPESWSLLGYSGLFTRFGRPVSGLEAMLRSDLAIERVEVIQCVRRMVPIPEEQQMRLDVANNTLDVDAVLGPEVEDRMGKMTIRIGPLSWEQYNALLPDAPLYNRLALLVNLYLTDPLVVDLELVLAEGEARPFVMDDPQFRLDYNVFLFDGVMPETSVRFPLAQPRVDNPHYAAPDYSRPAEEDAGPALIDYYRRERAHIEDLADGFARAHPGLEPLVSGSMADPLVERLFEGVAFLCALLQMKLDDDLPEIIHEVVHNVQPQHLCPIPAATVIAFTPKQNCTETQMIPAGTEVASIPIEGTSCRFTTVHPVEMHPLTLVDACYAKPPGKPALITLTMELKGMQLADWRPDTVRLFLSGDYGRAADLYLLLSRYLRRIIIHPEDGGKPTFHEPSNLQPVGFEGGEVLFPASTRGAVDYHCVLEHAILPEKFLFLDLRGWETWRDRGESARFEIRFELNQPPFALDQVAKDDFTLFATPAVNVFPHKASPIVPKEIGEYYPVIPAGNNPRHIEVYSIESVTGFIKYIAEEIPLTATGLSGFQSGTNAVYHEKRSESLFRQGLATHISVTIPPQTESRRLNSLVVDLLCTNGKLPERLRIGDIHKHTHSSLNFVTFKNCMPVTRSRFDTLGDNRLWRLFGMQFINLKLLTAESLRAVLKLISMAVGQDHKMAVRCEKRIEGIKTLQIEACDRIVKQVMKRGWKIRVKLDPEHFCSPGDLYLFCAMLDHFLRGFVSELYFSRTIIEEVLVDIKYEFPAMMGRKPLV